MTTCFGSLLGLVIDLGHETWGNLLMASRSLFSATQMLILTLGQRGGKPPRTPRKRAGGGLKPPPDPPDYTSGAGDVPRDPAVVHREYSQIDLGSTPNRPWSDPGSTLDRP